jgi:hypothetical protein
MDRNYFSADLLRRLTEAGIKTVFRMSMVSNCVKQFAKSNKSDIITTIKCKHGSKIKFRLIKYYVGRELYVIGTTIFNEGIYIGNDGRLKYIFVILNTIYLLNNYHHKLVTQLNRIYIVII